MCPAFRSLFRVVRAYVMYYEFVFVTIEIAIVAIVVLVSRYYRAVTSRSRREKRKTLEVLDEWLSIMPQIGLVGWLVHLITTRCHIIDSVCTYN